MLIIASNWNTSVKDLYLGQLVLVNVCVSKTHHHSPQNHDGDLMMVMMMMMMTVNCC